MNTVLATTAQAPPAHPVLASLEGRIGADPVLRALDELPLRVAGGRVRLTNVDRAACVLVRGVVTSGGPPAVGLALPRGRGPLAGTLGLFLALYRHVAPEVSGSLAVSTRRSDTAEELCGLSFDSTRFAELEVGRVVTKIVIAPGTGRPRRRPARKLLDGGERRGISQDDGLLLFCRPNTLTPLAHNVVWAMVVDTVGCSHPRHDGDDSDSWSRTWSANVADRRAQVWIGELGDEAFDRFCGAKGIPVVRFDWGLLAALAARDRENAGGPITSEALCARARDRSEILVRPVVSSHLDEELREGWFLYYKLREACGAGAPAALSGVARLLGVLSRLAVPLESYERAAARDPFARSLRRLERDLETISNSTFVGHSAKTAYNAYWGTLRGTIARLMRRAAEEADSPKFEAIFERAAAADLAGETLRVICQTRVEQYALRDALSDMELDQLVAVVTPADVLGYGSAGDRLTTLLLAPPPPWRASMLTSGERGRLEILCYPSERDRLAALLTRSALETTAANLEALRALGIPTSSSHPAAAARGVEVVVLDGFVAPARDNDDDRPTFIAPPAGDPQWKRLIGLYGTELRDEAELVAGTSETTLADDRAYDGHAHLARFTDADQVVFLRADRPVDVLSNDDDDKREVFQLVPADLQPGMTIAFLPGGGRSVLDELMAMFDETLDVEKRMYMPLWQRSIRQAIDAVGVQGLAEQLGRTKFAVWDWLAGRSTPREEWRFKRVLEISGDPEALLAQAPIWALLQHMRGHHRRIGRLNNRAIAEVLRDDVEPAALRELEHKIGRRLTDIYDHVERLTVSSVDPPACVPLAACGRFLSRDEPLLKT